jgi:hypothetical protein
MWNSDRYMNWKEMGDLSREDLLIAPGKVEGS